MKLIFETSTYNANNSQFLEKCGKNNLYKIFLNSIFRYSAVLSANANAVQNAPPQPTMNDDLIPDYMNILGKE